VGVDRFGDAGAEHEAWLGEVEGIDLTLTFLHDKRAEAHRIQQREPVHLGLPAVHLLATAIQEGRDLSSMSGILADSSYRLLPA
jgi:hypothetical protein